MKISEKIWATHPFHSLKNRSRLFSFCFLISCFKINNFEVENVLFRWFYWSTNSRAGKISFHGLLYIIVLQQTKQENRISKIGERGKEKTSRLERKSSRNQRMNLLQITKGRRKRKYINPYIVKIFIIMNILVWEKL